MIMARILCTQRVHQGIQMSQGSANGNDSHGSLTNKTASQPTSPGETWLVTAQTLDIPHKVWVSSWTGQSGPSLTSIDGVKFRGIQINASHCCCYKVNLNVGTGGGGREVASVMRLNYAGAVRHETGGRKGWGRNSSLQTFSTQRRKYNDHLYKHRLTEI